MLIININLRPINLLAYLGAVLLAPHAQRLFPCRALYRIADRSRDGRDISESDTVLRLERVISTFNNIDKDIGLRFSVRLI